MAKTTAPKVEEVFAPAKVLADMTLANFEKVAGLNVAMYNKYTSLALANARDAFAVKDMDSAKSYFEKQNAATKDLLEGMLTDSKAYAELTQAYATDVQKLVTEEIEKVSKNIAA